MELTAVREHLEKARETAKRLIRDAAASNDFHSVTRLATVAEMVDRILAETAPEGASSVHGDALPIESAARRSKRARSTEAAEKRARSRGKYPTFLREGTDLVKLGRSRSAADQLYEHRAPRPVVESVLNCVTALGGSGKRFTAEGILKQVGSGESGAVPVYQVYVALAWLKWSGLIIQHGRQGYTVALPQKLGELVWSAWDQLGTR